MSMRLGLNRYRRSLATRQKRLLMDKEEKDDERKVELTKKTSLYCCSCCYDFYHYFVTLEEHGTCTHMLRTLLGAKR